jgi:hypothetical protein
MGEELAGSDATRCSLVRQVDHQPCSRLSGRTRPLHAIQLHGTRPGGDWGGLDLGRDLGLAGPNRCHAGRQSRHATISTIAQSLRDVLQSSSPSLRCPRRKARCIPSSVYSRCLMAGKSSPGNFGLLQQYLPGPDSCSAASSIFSRALRPPGRAESAGYESSLMSCGRSPASSMAKMRWWVIRAARQRRGRDRHP